MDIAKMNPQLVLWILSGCGCVISGMLIILGFFFKRLIEEVDESSKGFKQLSVSLEKFNGTVVNLQSDSMAKYVQVKEELHDTKEIVKKLEAHSQEIDSIMSAVIAQGEAKNGWKISNLFSFGVLQGKKA